MSNKLLWHEMTSWLDMWCELIRPLFWKYLILNCLVAKIWLNFQFCFLIIWHNSIFEIALNRNLATNFRGNSIMFPVHVTSLLTWGWTSQVWGWSIIHQKHNITSPTLEFRVYYKMNGSNIEDQQVISFPSILSF